MRYFEVLPADGRYKGDKPLTYSYPGELRPRQIVTIPLRQRLVSGFVLKEVKQPAFKTRPIKSLLSQFSLPQSSIDLAYWLKDFYASSLGDSLKLFAPSLPSVRSVASGSMSEVISPQLELSQPLTKDQKWALKTISQYQKTTLLLHGDTGTGKTRVYVELAASAIKDGKSVIILTPEISLTPQLARVVEKQLHTPTYILHSQLNQSKRRKIWLSILESDGPLVIIGPRSALFSPVNNLGLIVVDEAHEPSYKQEQTPRYHTSRAASQLGALTGAKVILGTATPLLSDYYIASAHGAVVKMSVPATGASAKYAAVKPRIIDIKERQNFSSDPYISTQLIDDIKTTLLAKRQVLIYLNRRGSARLILCTECGWQLLCPNCDIPLVYHNDEFLVRCHTCGSKSEPPAICPQCSNPDVIYKSIGTKALSDSLARLFPSYKVQRFDSDNQPGQRVNELYPGIVRGEVDIIIGTQLLAKGFDLPKLGLVGIIAAESSLSLPDYSAEERTFQLLYQVIGRVGRGHGTGKVVVQSYNPASKVLRAAVKRDWLSFYNYALAERHKYRFPPSCYLLQLVCHKSTAKGAQTAAEKLKKQLQDQKLQVEIIGPAPSFFARRGKNYYWQIVVKSKKRQNLLSLSKLVPNDWSVNLDPMDLL